MMLVWLFASSVVGSTAHAQIEQEQAGQNRIKHSAKAPVSSADWHARKGMFFKRNWGVEVIGVHPVSSGYMLDFRYRIVDPVKARPLNDMKGKAYLIDEATGTRLAVPAMENVGELRSGTEPKADRTYFMIFGNPGRLVKPGSRVSVVIGNFRVDELVVN